MAIHPSEGRPTVEKGPFQESSCNFCTSRNPAHIKISSTSLARRQVLFVCERCTRLLYDELIEKLYP